jgi:hypothetical protein
MSGKKGLTWAFMFVTLACFAVSLALFMWFAVVTGLTP